MTGALAAWNVLGGGCAVTPVLADRHLQIEETLRREACLSFDV